MLKALLKSFLARLLGYGVWALGFWLLFRGFLRPNVPLAVLGGAMILGGMYLIVSARRVDPATATVHSGSYKEDNVGDPLDGSDQGR